MSNFTTKDSASKISVLAFTALFVGLAVYATFIIIYLLNYSPTFLGINLKNTQLSAGIVAGFVGPIWSLSGILFIYRALLIQQRSAKVSDRTSRTNFVTNIINDHAQKIDQILESTQLVVTQTQLKSLHDSLGVSNFKYITKEADKNHVFISSSALIEVSMHVFDDTINRIFKLKDKIKIPSDPEDLASQIYKAKEINSALKPGNNLRPILGEIINQNLNSLLVPFTVLNQSVDLVHGMIETNFSEGSMINQMRQHYIIINYEALRFARVVADKVRDRHSAYMKSQKPGDITDSVIHAAVMIDERFKLMERTSFKNPASLL